MLVWKPNGRWLFGSQLTWGGDNININLSEIGCGNGGLIKVVQDRVQYRAFGVSYVLLSVNAASHIYVYICKMEVVSFS
jgi:hypothetical protein